jgi:hypothetical protein
VIFREFDDVGQARFPCVSAVGCSDGVRARCGIGGLVDGAASDGWELVEVAAEDEVDSTVEFIGLAL